MLVHNPNQLRNKLQAKARDISRPHILEFNNCSKLNFFAAALFHNLDFEKDVFSQTIKKYHVSRALHLANLQPQTRCNQERFSVTDDLPSFKLGIHIQHVYSFTGASQAALSLSSTILKAFTQFTYLLLGLILELIDDLIET